MCGPRVRGCGIQAAFLATIIGMSLVAMGGCANTSTHVWAFEEAQRKAGEGSIQDAGVSPADFAKSKSFRLDSAQADTGARGVDLRRVYKKVAPTVVYINGRDGAGAGVLQSSDGWILTNAHVVANPYEDGAFRYVNVYLGALNDLSGMTLKEPAYRAYIHKIDAVRDLAALKIKGARRLPYAKFSPTNPAPGQPVACLGHAGVGLLWQIKHGNVAAIGRHGDIQKFKRASGLSSKEGELRVVQSTCAIGPGDSGGPIVDLAGRVLGLNAFGVPAEKGGATGRYHVHLKELKSFTQAVSRKPRTYQALSVAGRASGAVQPLERLVDLDKDGTYDCFLVKMRDDRGVRGLGFYMDLDQSRTRGRTKAELRADWRARRIDPEIYVKLHEDGRVEAVYDSNGDGEPDVVLKGRGSVGENHGGVVAIDVQKGEGGERALVLVGQKLFQPDLVGNDAKAHRRLDLFLMNYLEQDVGREGFYGLRGFPHPLERHHATIKKVGPYGHYISTPLQVAWVIDGSGKLNSGLAQQAATGRYLAGLQGGMDAAVVAFGGYVYGYYDRDGDGRLDLILVGRKSKSGTYVSARAYVLDYVKRSVRPSRKYLGGPFFSARYIEGKERRKRVDAALREMFKARVVE